MHFAVIASGSDGNAALVRGQGGVLVIDCGVSHRRLTAGLARLGVELAEIEGVLVTHEHADHVCGLPHLLANRPVPVLTARPTLSWLRRSRAFRSTRTKSSSGHEPLGDLRGSIDIEPARPVWFGEFEISALATSHDARAPLGFSIQSGGRRLAYVTDTGEPTPDLARALSQANLIALESNHCPNMLKSGPYPRRLKRRIRSACGHLSNLQTAEVLERAVSDDLECVVALHLSRTNNRHDLVEDLLTARLRETGADTPVLTAGRRGTGWL